MLEEYICMHNNMYVRVCVCLCVCVCILKNYCISRTKNLISFAWRISQLHLTNKKFAEVRVRNISHMPHECLFCLEKKDRKKKSDLRTADIYIHPYMYVYIYTYNTHTHTHTHTHTIYIYTRIYTYMHIYILCVCVFMYYTYICTCIFFYYNTYKYIHT